jgi:hypothetical protein
MKYSKILLMVAALIVAALSCNKDDVYRSSENRAIASDNTVTDGEMVVVALKSSPVAAPASEYIEIIGHSENAKSNSSEYFSITIYAPSIASKTYVVPGYTDGYSYDNATEYVTAYYAAGTTNEVADWYYSQYKQGAIGTVTISAINGSEVSGSYDMTLVSCNDNTKSFKLNGSFHTGLTSFEN